MPLEHSITRLTQLNSEITDSVTDSLWLFSTYVCNAASIITHISHKQQMAHFDHILSIFSVKIPLRDQVQTVPLQY